MSDDEIHSKFVSPYIKVLSDMVKRRFDDNTTKMCLAMSIFDPTNIPTSDTTYGSSQLSDFASCTSNCSLMMYRMIGKKFRNFLIVQSSKQLSKAIRKGDIAKTSCRTLETFPNLSMIAKIILVYPIGTAAVEHSFSTMNRICYRLRQRILPENLVYCMKVTTEGPKELTGKQAALIARKWHSLEPNRQIQI